MNHYNCIYMYVNKVNGKRYVGQAKDFNQRHKQHITTSFNKKTKHDYNVPFHRAIRKYGIENFDIKILAENISTQEKLNDYEKFFIKRYNTLANNEKGYNLSSGGSNGNNFAGKTEEEMNEIRKKMSNAQGWQKGKNNPNYGNHKLAGKNNPNYGKQMSEEQKQKISNSRKGKYYGENSPFYGKHHTEESKIKMSIAKSIKVQQLDSDGNIIKIWHKGAQEVERTIDIKASNINTCCRFWSMNCNKEEWYKTHKGKPLKSAGGFIWKYYTEDDK